DITLPGMLHAAIVRSPHAHARILGIDASRALKLPSVAGVVTFADLGDVAARPFAIVPPHAQLRGKNFCVLAADRARFVGDAMAGLLTVWAATQAPHQVRQFICEVLGLEAHRVRVIAPDVGGGFGAKLIVYPEDVLIPLLAMRLGRPVRWLEDRVEHMLTATQERTQTHTVEVGFDDEG